MRILILSWYFPPINEIGAVRVVFDQAESRMHVQKAILLSLLGGGLSRFPVKSAHV